MTGDAQVRNDRRALAAVMHALFAALALRVRRRAHDRLARVAGDGFAVVFGTQALTALIGHRALIRHTYRGPVAASEAVLSGLLTIGMARERRWGPALATAAATVMVSAPRAHASVKGVGRVLFFATWLAYARRRRG